MGSKQREIQMLLKVRMQGFNFKMILKMLQRAVTDSKVGNHY